ncbi:MAG: protoporphyrinogen oxidase [Chloroflexi bacterium]|nr:protoporphyrinogen oxidase [Chloroflexota bacterium]
MSEFAIIYTTREGQTARVAHHIADRLRADREAIVHVFSMDEAPVSLRDFDAIAIGGSVHFGHHESQLMAYVRQHRDELTARPSAFFSVSGAAGSEIEPYAGQAADYASEFMDQTGWSPDVVGVFAGAIKYTQYGFIKKRVMRRIARKEGEPTDMSRDHELTDWADVDAFADDVRAHLAPAPAPSEVSQ